MDRRSFVIGSTAAALVPGASFAQDAANYPARAVTFINPFPPGGAAGDHAGEIYGAGIGPRRRPTSPGWVRSGATLPIRARNIWRCPWCHGRGSPRWPE